jgi:hypothetical protein
MEWEMSATTAAQDRIPIKSIRMVMVQVILAITAAQRRTPISATQTGTALATFARRFSSRRMVSSSLATWRIYPQE